MDLQQRPKITLAQFEQIAKNTGDFYLTQAIEQLKECKKALEYVGCLSNNCCCLETPCRICACLNDLS